MELSWKTFVGWIKLAKQTIEVKTPQSRVLSTLNKEYTNENTYRVMEKLPSFLAG